MVSHNLGIEDLTKMHNRTRVTIYNWINAGMPYKREREGLKLTYRFNKEEVETWLDKQAK